MLLIEGGRRLATSEEGCLLDRVRSVRAMLDSLVASVVDEVCMLPSPVYGS